MTRACVDRASNRHRRVDTTIQKGLYKFTRLQAPILSVKTSSFYMFSIVEGNDKVQ